jgi:hypothetical protein
MESLKEVFSVWPSAAALARAIGVRPVTVRQWRNRGYRIPSRYWQIIQEAARERGREIPLEAFIGAPAAIPALVAAE